MLRRKVLGTAPLKRRRFQPTAILLNTIRGSCRFTLSGGAYLNAIAAHRRNANRLISAPKARTRTTRQAPPQELGEPELPRAAPYRAALRSLQSGRKT